MDTRVVGGRIPIGTFPIAASNALRRLGSFPLVGDVKVELAGDASNPSADVVANLQLPSFLRLGGADLRGQVRLSATRAGGLRLSSMVIGPLNANLGALASTTSSSRTTTGRRSGVAAAARACPEGCASTWSRPTASW
jgi:hypothetical protein